MITQEHLIRCAAIIEAYAARGLTLATAESCTGGLVSGALTAIAGSSAVVECGFVTYSNAAKQAMLDVSAATLGRVGAASEEVAREMAEGALTRANVDVAVSITGIAGPGGGSAEKPVGLVCFGLARRVGETLTRRLIFNNEGRDFIRTAAISTALELLELAIRQHISTVKEDA